MSQRTTVELDEFADKLGKWAHASVEEKRRATIRGIARSIPDLVAASPVDTGLYAASWHFTKTETGAVIGNSAPYAGIIEHGARPFTPPIGPLLAWAKRVLTGTKSAEGQTVQTGQPESDYSPEVWALAKYTQAKIAREGMHPRHILQNMIPQIMNNIRQELRESLA